MSFSVQSSASKPRKQRIGEGAFRALLIFMMFFSVAALAQQSLPPLPPLGPMPDLPAPTPKGSEPVPQNAAQAVFSAFDRYEVVALNAAHGNQDLDIFILDLLRNPAFPGKINDIVVECGNSLYQPLLDRYIAGDEVSFSDVQQVWRNTTQPMCGVSSFYQQLYPLVRRLNQRLPPAKRVRVLAADPPIDWSAIKTRADLGHAPQDRESSIASVMENEVLSKHRKALMLFGTAHLYHGTMAEGMLSAVARYEKQYPGLTLVIADHKGFGEGTGYAKYNARLESRMASWPVPSLVMHLDGTWLGDLLDTTYSTGDIVFGTKTGPDGKKEMFSAPAEGDNKFHTMADAYLYLGPRDLLLHEPPPANVFLDKSYMAEMRRRAILMGPSPVTDEADPDKVAAQGYIPFLYDADHVEADGMQLRK